MGGQRTGNSILADVGGNELERRCRGTWLNNGLEDIDVVDDDGDDGATTARREEGLVATKSTWSRDYVEVGLRAAEGEVWGERGNEAQRHKFNIYKGQHNSSTSLTNHPLPPLTSSSPTTSTSLQPPSRPSTRTLEPPLTTLTSLLIVGADNDARVPLTGKSLSLPFLSPLTSLQFPPSIPGAATDIELVVTAIALNIRVDIWVAWSRTFPDHRACGLILSLLNSYSLHRRDVSARLSALGFRLYRSCGIGETGCCEDTVYFQQTTLRFKRFDLTAIRELGDEFLIEFSRCFFGFASHSKTGWLDFWVGIQAFVSTPHSSNSTVGMQTQFARFSFLLSYCPNLKYRIPASESKAVLRFWLEFELMNAESDPEFIEISTEKRGPQGVDTLRLWEYNLKSHLCAIQLPGFQQIFAFQWPFDLKIKAKTLSSNVDIVRRRCWLPTTPPNRGNSNSICALPSCSPNLKYRMSKSDSKAGLSPWLKFKPTKAVPDPVFGAEERGRRTVDT
ncbi:hypothetical protein C8R45DRAFT_1098092 [Mycena sanguinolenta]|nr:hypothetical protein C8R45DRAFT_1098092 [Mycena sanguinolenta]